MHDGYELTDDKPNKPIRIQTKRDGVKAVSSLAGSSWPGRGMTPQTHWQGTDVALTPCTAQGGTLMCVVARIT
jgi:hypothetical protein